MNEFNLDYIINPIEKQTLNDLWDLYSDEAEDPDQHTCNEPECFACLKGNIAAAIDRYIKAVDDYKTRTYYRREYLEDLLAL